MSTVLLEPNALYVVLTQLMSPGCHWAIFYTDANSVAVRHHWSAVQTTRDPAVDPVEAYTYRLIHPVTVFSVTGNAMLAFIKIAAFNAPPEGIDMVAFVNNIFPGGTYPDVRANRRHGTRCRTWLIKALHKLREAGFINADAAEVAGYEATITSIGEDSEKGLAEFPATWTCIVTAV
jgi:hypothetical protein